MRFPMILLYATFATIATAAICPDAAAEASGQVGDWTVVDAIAVRDDSGIRIVVSDKPFDRAGIAADLRFDIGDTSAHEDATNANLLSLYIDDDGTLSSLGVGGSSSYSSEMEGALSLRSRSADAIAGRFDYDTMKFDFELPVWANGAIPRVGAALAVDGGEAGKALLAYLAALKANNFDAFVALSPPSWRDSMNASEAKGEGQLEIDAVTAELPQALKIIGGNGETERAWIDLSATREGKAVKAVATLERDAGGWYVQRIETLK